VPPLGTDDTNDATGGNLMNYFDFTSGTLADKVFPPKHAGCPVPTASAQQEIDTTDPD